MRSWLVTEENLTVKFPGLLNQFGIVEEDYKTRMIMDLIMKEFRIRIYMISSYILRRRLSELMVIFFSIFL